MLELNNLLTSYPLAELISIIVTIFVILKAVWTLIEWYLNKAHIYIGERQKKEKRWNDLYERIDNILKDLSKVKKQNQEIHTNQIQMEKNLTLVQEQLQEHSRAYLLDAHHKFCYEIKKIDDFSLQSIERRYLYYKTAGGDTFIDHLMEEIRDLPRISYYNETPIIPHRGEEKNG